jgi:hypothetical protein
LNNDAKRDHSCQFLFLDNNSTYHDHIYFFPVDTEEIHVWMTDAIYMTGSFAFFQRSLVIIFWVLVWLYVSQMVNEWTREGENLD